MKTTLSERDGNTVKFSVEVSSEEVQEAFDTRLRQLAREARIPGFRPGKAPLVMVRQRLGDEAIIVDAVDETMGQWFAAAMADLGLEPVERPDIDFGDELPELEKPLSFSGTVTVMPEVVLGEYKGLIVPKETAEVADEEVDAQMERLQDEFAELTPVSGRPAEAGDFVTVDFSAQHEGKPVDDLQASDFLFELGSGRMFPEVEEQLVGMNAGEERTFDFVSPEGLGEEAAGKTVEFSLTLKEIKEKVRPRPTDQWASEVSEFATLLELRQEIRKRVGAGKTYASDQRFRADAVKAAVDNVTLDLPEAVVQAEAAELLDDFKRSLESQGASLDAYAEAVGTPVEKMLEDIAPQAANNVKTRLVLEAVAKAEDLEATDEEVDRVVAQMAAAAKVEPKVLAKRLRKGGRLESLRSQLVRDKAVDLIAANAVAGAPEPKPEEAGEDPDAATPKKGSRAGKADAAKKAAAETAEAEPEADEKTDDEPEADEAADTEPVEAGPEAAAPAAETDGEGD